LAAIEIRDAEAADPGWWAETMPAGTSPTEPPTTALVAALLGTWWPDPERRTSIRGNLGARLRWREPDLHDAAAWDRRQHRRNGGLVILTVAFGFLVGLIAHAQASPGELLGVVPIALVALVAGAWAILR
jgi:hypothetical protein